MEYQVVKIKNYPQHEPYKYGTILGELVNGLNKVNFYNQIKEYKNQDLELITDGSITPTEVWEANHWKDSKNDSSDYIPYTEQYGYEKAYKKLYKEEEDAYIQRMVRYLELVEKGRKYEMLSDYFN